MKEEEDLNLKIEIEEIMRRVDAIMETVERFRPERPEQQEDDGR